MKPKFIHDSSNDEYVTITEVFDDLVYQPSWFDFESTDFKKIVDVGALIGSFSLWIHEKFPNAVIHAYEPDPESFDYLLKNIQSANAKDHIFAYKCAVWKSSKKLKLHPLVRMKSTSTQMKF